MRHNAYFIDFPANVPDTQAFWSECVADALADPRTAGNIATQLARRVVNLLDLPKYGRYQHSYEQLLAAHEPLIAAASDRVTVLGLGAPLAEDSHALYLSLATSPIPLSGEDLALLGVLAEFHVGDAQPEAIAVRESRAVVNRVRLEHGLALELDTPVDVLRLACALSDGDVSLREPTRFRSLRRAERRALLSALDAVAERQAPRRQRASPSRSSGWGSGCTRTSTRAVATAQEVFAVARGERAARSLAGRVDLALAAGDVDGGDRRAGQRARDAGAQRRPPGSRGGGGGGARGRGARGRPGGLDARAAVAARAPAQPLRHGDRARVRQSGEPFVGDRRRARAAARGHGRRARRRSWTPSWPAGCRACSGSWSSRRCGRSRSR